MHVPYISTNNNQARLLIILDNIRSRYGLDMPNNYPATLYTKGRLPTLSLECPSDPRFSVHLRSRYIWSCAVFSAQLDLASFYSSLLPSNCRLRIAQPYTGFHSSISIPNCAPQHSQPRTVLSGLPFGSMIFFFISSLRFAAFRSSAQLLTLFFNCAPQHSHSFVQPFLSSFCFFLLRFAVSLVFYLLQIPTDVDSIATDP